MRIAATFDKETNEIFGHFGRTEFFKLYDVKDDEIMSSTVISSDGAGHGALASVLADNSVDVLVCGGLGEGAQAALADAGIEVCAGASGDADVAVLSYISGDLTSTGANCDHHKEDDSCGESGCQSGCGGCGGGCGGCGAAPSVTGPNVGKTCRVHYQGTFNDGTQFDSSYDRGEPLEFICGAGMMIKGFDAAVANMSVGEIVNVHLMPEEAYGEKDPNAIIPLDIEQLPGSEELSVGEQVYLYNSFGQPMRVTVIEKTDTTITFDANHEMAGKELNFKIELVEIQ